MADLNKHFFLQWVFPDAEALLNQSFTPIDSSKKDCFVALDANVLLAPYKIDSASLEEIKKIYAVLSDAGRLLVPAHALREFEKNRVGNIGDLAQSLLDRSSKCGAPNEDIIEYLRGNVLYEEIVALGKGMREVLNDYRKKVKSLADELLEQPIASDSVRMMYKEVFASRICELNLDDKGKEEFSKELRYRFDLKIPPGYKDSGKADDGAGDLIIWKTLLEATKDAKKDLIFVTHEEKPDWFVKKAGTLQPKPELMSEYFRQSGGGTLHLMTLGKLMTLFEAAPSAVTAVEEASKPNVDKEPFQEVSLLSKDTRLLEIQSEIIRLEAHLTNIPEDLNEGLSLPWNRAAFSLRHQIALLKKQYDLLI